MISADQMMQYQLLPQSILTTLPGYQKWKKKASLDFLGHHISGSPCSPSRTTMYTGKHNTTAKVTDNIENAYQSDMPAIQEGGTDIYGQLLGTLGSFLGADFEKRYIGKFHIDATLNRQDNNKPIPTWNTRKSLEKYDLGLFNFEGDPAYDPHLAFYNDCITTQSQMPPGATGDYIDQNGNAFAGAIPYLKEKARTRGFSKPWCLMINYENPHDIMYYWSNVDKEPLTTQVQANQFPKFSVEFAQRQESLKDSLDTISSVFSKRDFNQTPSVYENCVTEPFPDGLLFSKSFDCDFPIQPVTNTKTLDNYISYSFGVDYLFTGMEKENVGQWKAYQQMYINCVRQMDLELEKVYDTIDELRLWNDVAVVLTADHGELCGSHGLRNKATTPYEQVLNVPLMIWSPELQKQNEQSILTSHINLVPTVLSLVGKEDQNNNLEASVLVRNQDGKLVVNENVSDCGVLFVCVSFMAYIGYIMLRIFKIFEASPGSIPSTIAVPEPSGVIEAEAAAYFDSLTAESRELSGVYSIAHNSVAIVIDIDSVRYKMVRFFSYNGILFDTASLLKENGELIDFFDEAGFSAPIRLAITQWLDGDLPNLPIEPKTDLLIGLTTFRNGCFVMPGLDKTFEEANNPPYLNPMDQYNYQFQVFNLTTDPDEVINLADDYIRIAENIDLLETLQEKLNELIVKQGVNKMFISLPADQLATLNVQSISLGSVLTSFWLAEINPVATTLVPPTQPGETINIPKRLFNP
jgi:arylsulfatase A-like enzyme